MTLSNARSYLIVAPRVAQRGRATSEARYSVEAFSGALRQTYAELGLEATRG